jgi:sulfur carrier protein ThiS
MRMHRGSSKGGRSTDRPPETLPLSASPRTVPVVIELTRGGSVRRVELTVPIGTPVRTLLREVGQRAEGSAVLIDDTPVPLDTPVEGPVRLVVVPTFSGG